MNEGIPEELFTMAKKAMGTGNSDSLPLSRIEEQKMELIMAGYRGDKYIRAWLLVAMDAYARAVVERKTDIFIDGFLHLTEMLFDKEGGETHEKF